VCLVCLACRVNHTAPHSLPPCALRCHVVLQVVGGSSGGSSTTSALPPLALPERFQIIYRDSGPQSALSIWRPVPPRG
jgi:hypothetical protein